MINQFTNLPETDNRLEALNSLPSIIVNNDPYSKEPYFPNLIQVYGGKLMISYKRCADSALFGTYFFLPTELNDKIKELQNYVDNNSHRNNWSLH